MESNSTQYPVSIEPVSLDVLIISRGADIEPLGRRMFYQPWDIQEGSKHGDRSYYALVNKGDTELYAGQRATVTGSKIILGPSDDFNMPDLVLDDVVDENFVIEGGQYVELLNPKLSTSKQDTYSSDIMVEINGRIVKVSTPIIMKGTKFKDRDDRPLAVITRIHEPNPNRGYLLISELYHPE